MKAFIQLLVWGFLACANADDVLKKTTSTPKCATSTSKSSSEAISTSTTLKTLSSTSSQTSSTSLSLISSTTSSTSTIFSAAASSTYSGAAASATSTVVDTNGLNFTYPYPVNLYNFTSQRLNLQMAYMDISPPSNVTEKGVIVLLHGKNFCGATWNFTIITLSNYGYRVIVPDQIGFCKSTKPVGYQFSFMQLATNTNELLQSLNITSATIMGHSMGGMLSVRYTLMFESQVDRLVMVDPLGLENWFEKGTPYQTIDKSYITEQATTFASIQTYENTTYYVGQWEPAYDVWVQMLLDVYKGSEGAIFTYNQAQTTDMIFTQPIIQELPNLSQLQSILLVGDNDTTAIGKAWSPPEVQAVVGHYEVLGQQANALIGANNTLVEFIGLGHAPHIEAPTTFFNALLAWLP